MVAKLTGEQDLVFAQALFLSDDDIRLAVETIAADAGNKETSKRKVYANQ